MSIRALRTLLSIHRHGSFRAAAEAENLTPSAVSLQMRTLEETWDLTLFERSQRTPKLNETGLALVGEAEAVIAAYDSLADRVSPKDEISGELILGAVPTTLTGLVPLALSELKKRHPGIRVRIVPGLSNQLLSEIDRGQIHAAVISRPDMLSRSMLFSRLAEEVLVLLVSENTEDLAPAELLRSRPFIRFNRDAVVGKQIETWLQNNGISVNDAMELEGLEAISSMVAAELGISIVPQRCIRESDRLPLKTLSLGDNSPSRVLGLASRQDTPRAGLVTAAEAALLEAVSIGEFTIKSSR
ncbi:MAG: LysR family transcriptional regulator [Pseudomonadota bacterium]